MITLLTTGSRGDTQPYLALGQALQRAGHQVRVAAFGNFETLVKSSGLEFYPVRGDVSQVATSDIARGARQADNPLKLLLSFNQLKTLVFDLQQDFFNACAEAEAVVYHPGAAIGYFAARHFKIPSILATPFPMAPTREYPSLAFYNSVRLGRTFNFLSHKIFEQMLWVGSRSVIQRFWKQEFGRVPENLTCPFPRQATQTSPTVISCSRYVFPRPKDWSEHVHADGYWFFDEENWQPSSDLLNFLERGDPPVYIGFGSIGDPAAADQTTELVIQALHRAGQRGILAKGWQGLTKVDSLPEDIFFLESAPHAWLFPRMAAVVHHGGAGTTAAGLRAGVPSLIIPHGLDHFAWGRRVYELGVGPRPLPRKQLTAERLAGAIQASLAKEVQEKARDLGQKIQSENGAETAAKIIIDCLTKL